tara:strand:+ start:1205 stop:4537 length:3333 start_codon:yes stop_codon:yes gene_type:complete
MSGTDSDIDLNNINNPIYKEDIKEYNDKSGQELYSNTSNCIEKNEKYIIRNTNDIDYKKYFKIRLKGDLNSDNSSELDLDSSINLSEPYIRINNTDNTDSRLLSAEWAKKYDHEKELFINSIIASTIIKHKYHYNKKHSLIECNKVLEEIDGCYYIFPFIEIDETSNDSAIETKYNIILPDRLKLINNDIKGINDDKIKPMFSNKDDGDDKTFIEPCTIAINSDITHTKLISDLKTMKFIGTNQEDIKKTNGINFIDGINNIIDHEIYKKFIDILNNSNKVDKFNDYIKTDLADSSGKISKQFESDNALNNYEKLLNPLHIVPNPTHTNIKDLRKEIENYIQDKINYLYNFVPKVNDTKTKFVYKQMIIHSIYFTKDTYRISEEIEDTEFLNKVDTTNYKNNWLKMTTEEANALYEEIKSNENIAKLSHFDEDKEQKPFYHFTINVKLPICNTSPIRKNISDVLLSNNLIVVIISYLIAILIQALISCCLEFWLKYGAGTSCIYITNTCKNIGDKTDVNISLIDYFFRHRLTNFPYQHCDGSVVQSQSGGNTKKFNYPILNKGNGRLCIPEDSYNTYSNKRPFPYNLIDYGEKNFDSESIKYLFRTIVIFILCFLIPLRYIFNKCFNKISNIYDKYISRNKLLSSIVFVLLPLSMPFISILILVSLACSLILYCIYTLLSMIHNIFMLFNSVRFAENIWEAILCILGTGFTLLTLYLLIVAIFQPKHIKIEKDDDGNYNNTDDRMLNEWFHKLSTLAKFGIICGSLIFGIIFFGIKNIFFVGKDPMTNERTYNTYMEKWYKIIFYPFDYDNLRATQKEDLGNYRIDKEVNRPDIGKQVYKPLAKFLTIKKSKISVRTVLLLLFIITAVFYFTEKNKDPYSPANAFMGILMCLFFFNILLFLYSLLNKYLIYCKKYNSFKEIPDAVYFFSQKLCNGDGARIFNNIIFFILAGAFGLFSVVNSKGTCPFNSDINQIQLHKQDGNVVNSLNILSQDTIDLSEFILLLKKMIYLICVSIILLLTSLALPFVMIITLLFILFELLYIFLIVPFTKGGHFIFRIMRNRYQLLTYMLCTAVILYIHNKEIFSNNTNTVVYTMSAILGLIVIYNFVNE